MRDARPSRSGGAFVLRLSKLRASPGDKRGRSQRPTFGNAVHARLSIFFVFGSESPSLAEPERAEAMNCSCLKLSHGEVCGTCRFGFCWRCTYPHDIQCRCHAPAARVEPMKRGVWADVARTDWCGDYERDPSRPEEDFTVPEPTRRG